MDSEAVFQAIEADPLSSRREPNELSISVQCSSSFSQPLQKYPELPNEENLTMKARSAITPVLFFDYTTSVSKKINMTIWS